MRITNDLLNELTELEEKVKAPNKRIKEIRELLVKELDAIEAHKVSTQDYDAFLKYQPSIIINQDLIKEIYGKRISEVQKESTKKMLTIFKKAA
jgi:hypothetical protein